jgi:hypothetical protein
VSPRAVALAEAIRTVETGGNFNARGKSGEGGSFQHMPATWRHHSTLVYGYVKEMTPEREWYVVTKLLDKWLSEGMTESQIALRWNAGGATKCSSGINSKGVHYDSCAYQQKVLAQLR